MQLPDLINGSFEFFGGFFILNHCRVLIKEKRVAGISILSTVFFFSWGVWNCFYYPYLDQWLSFFGGLLIASSNILWICLLLYYKYFYRDAFLKRKK
jgi:hypothetical protein